MKKIATTLSALILIISYSYSQECLDIKYKLRGYFYAGTSQVDSLAAGGFYESKNSPKAISPKIHELLDGDGFKILVLKDTISKFNKELNGFKVLVLNKSDSLVNLFAQDSRLEMKRQVYYNHTWQDIEYLPSSWCGNSYHTVAIKPNTYWDFTAPCIMGKIEAKFRFQLYINDELTIYSNEFLGSFNKSQLTIEEGHKRQGLMDSYDN